MNDLDDAFVASVSRWRIVAAILGCLGFVAIGIVLVRIPDDMHAQVIGWITIATFGAFAAIGLARLRTSGEMLRVDRTGIRYAPWSRQTIAWDEIVEARVASTSGQRFLVLELVDPERFRQTATAGLTRSANRALGFGDVSIGTQASDRRFDDFVAAVEHHGTIAAGR